MAGWTAYTTALVGTRNVSFAAIVGFDGAVWANSDAKKLPISAAETKALVAGFKDATPLRSSGLFVGGVKYITLGCDDTSIGGKKGTGGVCIAKTKKTVVIGVYSAESGIQAGPCNSSVQKMAADLIKKGY